MNETDLQKGQLRKQLASIRDNLAQATKVRQSRETCEYLIALTKEQRYTSVMTYIPFRSELDVWPYIEWCWQQHIEVLVPRCNVTTHTMTLYPLYNKDQLRRGAYGIMEPDIEQLTETNLIPQAVLVPGLAFNDKGHRLGYGGGYYDRYYAKIQASTSWIGVCHEQQLVSAIPVDEYDIILNFVVSNKGIKKFS